MSVEIENLSKAYRVNGRVHRVIDNMSLTIPPRANIGLLGRNGAGKSTLLRLIGGAERPDSGRIIRNMTVSWPLGFAGFFQGSLSGAANAKFCARIYGRDPREIQAFVQDFSELGEHFYAPVRTYSTGMRARLGFALSMSIKFDCVLIDEIMSVGDAHFRKKSQEALDMLRETAGIILVAHNPQLIKRNCDRVVILGMGPEPILSTDVDGAIKEYTERLTSDTPNAGPMAKAS